MSSKISRTWMPLVLLSLIGFLPNFSEASEQKTEHKKEEPKAAPAHEGAAKGSAHSEADKGPNEHKKKDLSEDPHEMKQAAPDTPASQLEKPGCEVLPQKKSSELWDLSQCHYKAGNIEKTIDVLREITRRDPHDLEAYFTSSWLLWTKSQAKTGDAETRLIEEAFDELDRAVEMNPTHWEGYVERGDFYFLRTHQFTKAYAEYTKARTLYDGDFARKVMPADVGRKASIEARIARTAERLDRKGEAVEASCRALFFDPDDKGSQERITRLHGSCTRKKVKDPRNSEEKKESEG